MAAPWCRCARYEILDAGATYNPLMATEANTEHMAYELVARLYYSEFSVKEEFPPSVVRLFYQEAQDGLHASFEQLTRNIHGRSPAAGGIKLRPGKRAVAAGMGKWPG